MFMFNPVSFDDFAVMVSEWLEKVLACNHGDDRIALIPEVPEDIRYDHAFGQVAPAILDNYEASGSKIFYEECLKSFKSWVKDYYGLSKKELKVYVNLFNLAYGLSMDGPGFDSWFKSAVKVL